ncbi:zwei Ig domain protein zig-8-like isoform X2 [Haliotis rufescens]|uniref:zwei Ig domain protein zig-8-like isoform X2 n=1 Tax=Haliotis rufescens TaxID=6454 RepID=UPI001EAFDDCF|nr:zwei Ig domain protein zig-8-like isoform X2 [Haliotis rufescens]
MRFEAGQPKSSICRAWQVISSLYCRLLQLIVFLVISVALSGCSESVKRQLTPTPKFLPGNMNVTVREGAMAVLPCKIRNLGTKKVAWRRLNSDQFLTIGKITWIKQVNMMVEHETQPGDITTWDLLIKNVKANDTGIYECQITSTQEYAYHVQLNVVGPPITNPAISVIGSTYVDYGESIKLICNATGGPHIPEEIDWFKDGDKIDAHKYKDIVITKYRSLRSQSMTSELLVDRSTTDHSGTYICRSSQDVIASIKVTVLVEPTILERFQRKSNYSTDTTNVKRGTGSQIHPNHAGVSISSYAKTSLMLSLVVSLLLVRCVL